jgi:hypothetical protein
MSIMKNTARIGIVLPLLSLGLAGCNDGHSLSGSSAPSSISQPSSQPGQPTVTSITPNTGSTRGDGWGFITGTQFQSGATVTLGNGVARTYGQSAVTIYFEANASAAGRVDVIVTNPNGLSGNLAGAYTFAPPETFDLNGDWIADAYNNASTDREVEMQFTIRDNMLVRVSCDGAVLTLPSGSPVHNGELSFLGDDGAAVSGRFVSPVRAKGTVTLGPCIAGPWWADKRK